MKVVYLELISVLMVVTTSCFSQNNNEMKEQVNPLLCKPQSGLCELPIDSTSRADSISVKAKGNRVKVVYFTDPICSACWGIEPQLRKLELEYGDNFDMEYRMGGLLPDWSYNSGGISKPADVAHHWDEVSVYYDMPIDGNVWLEDPLPSSYPPSIAFKAAQIQDNEKAILFLREIREMVFLQKKNITKWEYLESAARTAGLDIVKFKTDYEGRAKDLFEEDLKSARESGVRGFPTLFFSDTTGQREIVYGSKPYSSFENTLRKLAPAVSKADYEKSWSFLFSNYHTMTAREFSELAGMSRNECDRYLDDLAAKGQLEKLNTKNGSIWKLKNSSR